MLNIDYTPVILNLQDVLVKKIELIGETYIIDIEMPLKEHNCPCCSSNTIKTHDYRYQKIKDIPAFGANVILNYRKRRYVCKECGKRFSEQHPFVPKYYRMTNRLVADIIEKLKSEYSFTSVGQALNLSVSTVIRVFDLINVPKPSKLPKVFAIDEFKGNTGKEKYQAIITDPENKVVLDILPCRNQEYLMSYLKQWSVSERSNTKYFVSDMWQPYTDIAPIFFKESISIIDRYHFIRQMVWAFDKVRKRIQKKYSKDYRKLFKSSRKVLIKHEENLKEWEKEKVNAILDLSDEMLLAYVLKEKFYKLMTCKNRDEAKKIMSEWILMAQNSKIPEYTDCAATLTNWSVGILNSFDVPYSNGFTEGCNNKIKVLKRNAYGYRNFKRFRNRILHMFSDKKAS